VTQALAVPVALKLILPGVAIGSSIFQAFSPLQSVLRMTREKSVGEQESLPFVSLAFSCAHWCLYGLLSWILAGDASLLVLLYANVFGTFLGIFYATVFQRTCKDNMKLGKLNASWKTVAAILASEIAIALLLNSKAAALSLFGWTSTILSVCLAVAPLAALPTILRTRSVTSMPKDLILATLLASTAWLLTGLTIGDSFVVATNAVNTAISCLNVTIMVMFSHPPKPMFNQQ